MTNTEMDLNLLYRDFIAADKEFMFHSAPGTVLSFHDVDDNMFCAVTAYQHPDPDLARDQLSTNRHLPETADLAMFGMMIVAGSTPDHFTVLIPGHCSSHSRRRITSRLTTRGGPELGPRC